MKLLLSASVFLASFVPCVAGAVPCQFDMTPLPVTRGVVARVVEEGVLLKDGMTVLLPEEFLASVRVGQTLAVRGLVAPRLHQVQAFALDGAPPVCPSRQGVAKGAFPGSAAYDRIQGENP